MELQELDEDMDAVFKITDKNRQKLVIEVHDDDGNITRTNYSLAKLTLTERGEDPTAESNVVGTGKADFMKLKS